MVSAKRARRMHPRCVRLAAWAASVSTVAMIVGALPNGAVAAEVKEGGTLIFARPDEPLTLDPFIPADNGSI